MNSYLKICILLLLVLTPQFEAAFSTNPPIPEKHPGFWTGSKNAAIEIEAGFDLLCSDCAFYSPLFQEFLDLPFLGSTVRENIMVNYVFMPLPFHHEAWIVTKLTIYFIDECYANPATCQYEDYIIWTLANQNNVLLATTTSEDALIQMWTAKVAA